MRPMPELAVEEVPTEGLVPYANNAKIHADEQIDQIAASIEGFGSNDPVAVWDSPEGTKIVEGHGRVIAAKKLGLEKLPAIRLDHLTDGQRRAYTHVHNQLTMNTGWDFDKLGIDLEELDFDFGEFGFDLDMDTDMGDEPGEPEAGEESHAGSLTERFGIAPFSVLNARSGEWAERKRAWMSLGIRSELGRGGSSLPAGASGKVAGVPGGSPLPLNRAKASGCKRRG